MRVMVLKKVSGRRETLRHLNLLPLIPQHRCVSGFAVAVLQCAAYFYYIILWRDSQ